MKKRVSVFFEIETELTKYDILSRLGISLMLKDLGVDQISLNGDTHDLRLYRRWLSR